LISAVLIGLLWVVRAVILEAALRNRQVLGDRTHDAPRSGPGAPGGRPPSPRVSIILAAKDEESTSKPASPASSPRITPTSK
jgi:hypothetical protein